MNRNIVYISGPITNNQTYVLDFARAEEKIKEAVKYGEYDFSSVINPAKVCSNLPEEFRHEDYMEVCYRLIDLSQSIYMLKGWQESVGARKEHAYAKLLGVGVYYEELSSGELQSDC